MSKKGIKLTIVEEDEVFVDALKRMTQNVGTDNFTLSVANYSDGQAFLLSKPEEGNQFHIVIINDILSKRSGVNVTQTLRQLPDSERFFIVLLTQGKSEDDMVHALRMGVDYYLQRPINIRALQAIIERTIERHAYEFSI